MRKVVAAYLVVAALFAVVRINTGGSEIPANTTSMGLMAAFLGATFAGGVGLFLDKNWGYWTAVTVLGLQLVKIQVDGFTYDVLAAFGIYLYAAGEFSIGVSAAFDPSFQFLTGTSEPWWFGVNLFVALLFGYLLIAKKAEKRSANPDREG